MTQFEPKDVRAVAQAVIERSFSFDDSGKNAYAYCVHCDHSHHIDWNDGGDEAAYAQIKHGPDCVYLIALDLLT